MEPKHTNDEGFNIFVYDYLINNSFLRTAESFTNDLTISGLIPSGSSTQQMPGFTSQSQAPITGAIMDTTPQVNPEAYSIKQFSSFPSDQMLFCCACSSDGKIVASGGREGKPFICHIETGDSVTTTEAHLSTILDVRFLPGSTIFATSSADNTVKLWDAITPERLFNLDGHDGIVKSLDFHPTKEILCSSDNLDVIQVWDLNQRVRIKRCEPAGGSQVRFQPGPGKLLAVAKRNIITILDSQSLGILNCLQGHVKYIRSICWDVTGQLIASVSEDNVCVWSLFMAGKFMYEYPSKGKLFTSIIFHPQHPNVLVVAGVKCMELLILEDKEIRCIHSSSGLSIIGLAASAQNEFIASISDDCVVNIWK